jgi:hypothetical protein
MVEKEGPGAARAFLLGTGRTRPDDREEVYIGLCRSSMAKRRESTASTAAGLPTEGSREPGKDIRNGVPEAQAYLGLVEAGHSYRLALEALQEAVAVRDAAILANSAQGVSRRDVADAAGITVGRVQQVVSAHDSSSDGFLVERVLGWAVRQLPAELADRWEEEWRADLNVYRDRPVTQLACAVGLIAAARRIKGDLAHEDGQAMSTSQPFRPAKDAS